ncbi:AMP-binding protein [bacterium]|nr:AMP-binding protein [bacterium]
MENLCFSKREIESSLSSRFSKVVAAFPGQVAITHNGNSWTYRELNDFAERIASGIFDSGCGDQPIAIAGDTTPSTVAAILATFKIGQPFVFIGPELPDSRARYILQQTGCRCVVCETDDHARPLFSSLERSILIFDHQVADNEKWSPATFKTSPDDLAYIVFTSGSTGKPKGVPQTHRTVLADIRRQGQDLKTTQKDTYGLLYSLGGSAAICHLAGAFLHGARLSLFDLRKQGLTELAKWLEGDQVSILDINVSTFRQLCRGLGNESEYFPNLRILAPGSEPVHRYDVELFERYFSSDCLFQNAFGTSETRTVTQLFLKKGMEFEYEDENVSIGKAVEGKEVLLLDDSGKEVPNGIVGEMVVRSRFIANRYWKEPKLSATRFQRDPKNPLKYLYFTNDLAKRLDSGAFVHLGRRDFSAKINGMLVAYAEVEAAIRSQMGVTEAVVVAVDRPGGNKALSCFVVLERGHEMTLRKLKVAAGKKLMPQMIPSIIRFVDVLPYLPNGKLNRRALIESLQQTDDRKLTDEERPKPGNEQLVAASFSALLGLSVIGINDDFFNLGGDSLLTLALALDLEKQTKIKVSIADVMRFSTPKKLAKFLAKQNSEPRKSSPIENQVVALSGNDSLEKIFLVPGRSSAGSEFRGLADTWSDSYSLYCIQHGGMDRKSLPDASIEQLGQRIARVISEMCSNENVILMGFSYGALGAFEGARILASEGKFVHVLLLDYPNQHGMKELSQPVFGDIRFQERIELIQEELSERSLSEGSRFLTKYLKQRSINFVRRLTCNRFQSRMLRNSETVWTEDWIKMVSDANKKAARRYKPKATKANITVICASEGLAKDRAVTECGMGWKGLDLNMFQILTVPGDHFILAEQNLPRILPVLQGAIEDLGITDLAST